MPTEPDAIRRFLATHPPFDLLSAEARAEAEAATETLVLETGAPVYRTGERLDGLYAIAEGTIEITSAEGDQISRLGMGESFGERGLLRGGRAPYDATAGSPARLYCMPAPLFHRFLKSEPGFASFFAPAPTPARAAPVPGDLGVLTIGDLMSAGPVTVPSTATVAEAAREMTERHISCVLVADEGALVGLVTSGDLCARVIADGLGGDTPVSEVMTRDPLALQSDSIGLDAIALMVERRIGHLPVVEGRRPVGIVTRTDLLMHQALSSPLLLGEIARAQDDDDLAAVTAKIPQFLAQLVGSGAQPHVVCRLVTDVTDALTRRLVRLAEEALGPPPVPYLWAVCGSQGRQEQTGVSDQDNCLILDDGVKPEHQAYFEAFARRVSDGLDHCGFYYCPGDMMATTLRWRQPVKVWREYFAGWIRTPDPMAQMLASVMFDLRPVAGEASLLEGLQAETLKAARANSIFVSHMIRNALTHQPPLGLFRGFALVRSGEHKDSIDLKLNGVVPVVDLARVYALMGEIAPVNTRARLIAAREKGIVSDSGGRDLLAAYDLIAETRLAHQAAQVRAGQKPGNFLPPAQLSELERNHLKDAFIVVKTMQAALAQGRHTLA